MRRLHPWQPRTSSKHLARLSEINLGVIVRAAVAVGLVVWVAQALLGSSHGIARINRFRRENIALAARADSLRAQRDSLARVESLQTAPLYLEKLARERYGLARPGEVIYRVTPQKSDKNEVGEDE